MMEARWSQAETIPVAPNDNAIWIKERRKKGTIREGEFIRKSEEMKPWLIETR